MEQRAVFCLEIIALGFLLNKISSYIYLTLTKRQNCLKFRIYVRILIYRLARHNKRGVGGGGSQLVNLSTLMALPKDFCCILYIFVVNYFLSIIYIIWIVVELLVTMGYALTYGKQKLFESRARLLSYSMTCYCCKIW